MLKVLFLKVIAHMQLVNTNKFYVQLKNYQNHLTRQKCIPSSQHGQIPHQNRPSDLSFVLKVFGFSISVALWKWALHDHIITRYNVKMSSVVWSSTIAQPSNFRNPAFNVPVRPPVSLHACREARKILSP
ncbi:hypothetical protein RRG08_067258 [Elysia crispata]|uniref:Uncharacterized protein n=1 Tax=Elysia crispata TaxID=231223 RepID=A0AAE0ZVD5_9GAST|nr:hypothetical protein RRG08_067258 [Elysia crispata]